MKIYSVPWWKWGNHDYVDPVCLSADGPHKLWNIDLITASSMKKAKEVVEKVRNPEGFGKIKIIDKNA